MRKSIILLLLVFMGCLNPPQSIRYVCPDGSIVDESRDCQITQLKCPPCGNTQNRLKASSEINTSDCESLGCPQGTRYVASRNSEIFHLCRCTYASKIKAENRVCFNDSQQAFEGGFKPARCLS